MGTLKEIPKETKPERETSTSTEVESDHETKYAEGFTVPLFTKQELTYGLKRMQKGRCADTDGISLEMFLYSGEENQQRLLECLNNVLVEGVIPSSWCNTFFTLLHKGGPIQDANNWRPIAILSITYKIFARLIYHRIRHQLDAFQSEDQFGFRPGRSTSHALLILESMLSKGVEYNVPMWVVTIDLKKAFDRVDHTALFNALRQQMDPEYVSLLEKLYEIQYGNVGSHRFRIARGVRQGDVLSPILFNAILEHAMRKWKLKLRPHGFSTS